MPHPGDTCLVIQPNASMNWSQAAVFLGITATVSLGVATAFALVGYWPILPFAGLELLALTAALVVSLRENDYREVVTVDGDDVRVEAGSAALPQCRRRHWQARRAWVGVQLQKSCLRNGPSRLMLTCSGRGIEIGACLTDEERQALADRLRVVLAMRGDDRRSVAAGFGFHGADACR